MHSVNQNDNRFQDPDRLPEEFTFRQQQVWQQLEQKLDDRVKKISLPAVSVAAAILIYLSVWIYSSEPPKQSIHAKPITQITISEAPQTTPVVKRVHHKVPEKIKPHVYSIMSTKKQEPKVDSTQQNISVVPVHTMDSSEKTDVAVINAVSPSRKYRIAHANELNMVPPASSKNPTSIARQQLFLEPEVESRGFVAPERRGGVIGLIRLNNN